MTHINLFGECGCDYRPADLVAALKIAQDPLVGDKALTVDINSIGGDAYDGVAMYNLLEQAKLNGVVVRVNILGLAASAASVVAMAASPGELRMHKSAQLMIHRASSGVYGTKEDHQSVAAALEGLDASLAQIYGKRMAAAGKGEFEACVLQAADMMVATTYLDVSQAVACGLCDGLVASEQTRDLYAIAALDTSRMRALGAQYAPVIEKITAAQAAMSAAVAAVPDKPAETKGETVTKDELIKAFGELSAEDQAAAKAALAPEVAEYAAVAEAIGAKGDEAIGRIHAWKSSNEAAAELLAEAERAAQVNAEAEKVNALLSDATKVVPFVAKQIRAKLTDKSITFAAAQAWVNSLPTIPAAKTVAEGAATTSGTSALTHNGKTYAQLTGVEQAALKRSDLAQFNAMRDAHFAGKK